MDSSGTARPARQASTTGMPSSAAAMKVFRVWPAGSKRITASIFLPICLLSACTARAGKFCTRGRFCFFVRSVTYSQAPPPPTPTRLATVHSSGRSSSEIMVNLRPCAYASFTRLTKVSVFELRLAWIDEPCIMSIISCSVSVRILGCCANAMVGPSTKATTIEVVRRRMMSSSNRSDARDWSLIPGT